MLSDTTRSAPGSSAACARNYRLFGRAYERQLARVNEVDDETRLRPVLRALNGEWVDSGELGYDLAGQHVAVVADKPALLDAVARLTHGPQLRVQASDGTTWGWLGGRTRISDEDLNALIAAHGSSDATVAIGQPADGIGGFAASHHQAREARAIAIATNQRVVRFADVQVLIAVLRDGDLAQGLIKHELGELVRASDRMGELRETLRAYLEHGQSVSVTAALRQRNRKTIERHLRSAEELIHHRASDRSDEVLIALRIADILRHRA